MGSKFNKLRIVFILFILVFTFNSKSYSNNKINKGFDVLILNSYHQGHHWESNIIQGLEESIMEKGEIDINFKIEYLDFRNRNNKEYIQSLKQMLNKKYPKGSIDAIYTVDDESYEAFKEEIFNTNSSFYNIPLVFSGSDYKLNTDESEKKYMTGIYHKDDVPNLFKLINDLNPDIKVLNIIIEDSKYGDATKFEVEPHINKYEDLEVNYIETNYLEEILEKLDKLGNKENTVNIIAGEFQCINSKRYQEPKYIINKIKEYNTSPIYSNDQTYINAGILGGHIDIGQEQGKIIADMLIKLKDGIKIEEIESVSEPVAKGYIDYNSVYEYNIDTFSIPKDMNIINKHKLDVLMPVWMKWVCLLVIVLILICIIYILCITRKYKREELKKQKEKEKEKEREQLKSDFIVNLSHELRTPINIILGTSKVIENNINKGVLDKGYISSRLDNINRNSYRLLKISNNIIDITKVESGMLKLNLEKCNIVSIIEEIFESSIDFASKKNINMIFDTVEEEIITSVDVFQIQRVVLNMLSNAIKFTYNNGTIRLDISNLNESVIIAISDNGVGIPEDKLEQIFYKFFQVDNLYTRKSEGSGIGLCIVKEIIEMHNGKIEVKSEINKGTTFKIYIPRNSDTEYKNYDNIEGMDVTQIIKLEMSDI